MKIALSKYSNAVIKPAIILVLIALILNISSSLLPTQNAQAAGDWLTGYEYRTKVPVNSTVAGAQTDYQMSVVLHSGTGTSSAGVVYLSGHLQDTTTFNDIRFTASDSSTQKSFWIEKVEDETGGRKATVWVKLDTPVSGSTDYWLYYGKAGDSNASSYDNTFTKDFGESGLVGLWHMDEQVPGSELTTNGGFENWTGANCDNWTFDGTSAGVRDITKETTTIHSGSNAVKLTATNAGGTAFGLYQNIATTNNAYYQVSVYEEFASRTAGTLKFEAYDNTNSVSLGSQSITTTSAAYSLVNFRFVSTNTTNVKISIYLNSETTTGVAYVDDITVKQSSNTLTDSSPSAIPAGTINGAARTSTDGGQWGSTSQQFSTGSALEFDGKNDSADLGSPAALHNLTSKSVFVWVKPTAFTGTDQYVYYDGYWDAEYGDYISTYASANNVVIYVRNTSGTIAYTASISYTPDTWIHVGYIWDGTNVRFYKNGVQVGADKPLTGTISSAGSNTWLGSWNNALRWFQGSLDDFRIYNRGLSVSEIQREYIRSKYASTAPTWATPSSEEQYTFAVTSNAATLLTKNSATLNGNLIGMGDNSSVSVYYKWGTTSGSLDHTTSTQTLSARGAYSQAISGLSANTIYYFQAYAEGTTTVTGSELSFRTAIDADFDYYNAFANTDGTMSFTNKTTGETILDSSPKFYLNYGAQTTSDVSPTNPSFETGAPGTRPTGWTINPADNANTTIDNSAEQASAGVQSLKISMNSAEPSDNRNIYSSLIPINQDGTYTISWDSYTNSFTSGTGSLYVQYYNTADGSGTAYQTLYSLASLSNTVGSWQSGSYMWVPPVAAKSFRVWFYFPKTDVWTLYLDNIHTIENQRTYISNGGGLTSNVSTVGNDVTVTATDYSASAANIAYKYELNTHSSYVKVTPTITYKQNVSTAEERFDFIVPSQTAQVMTRDSQLTSFDTANTYYSDQYNPKVVQFTNSLSFLGNDTMQSMRLRTSGATNSQVSFYTDYSYNHPHAYHTTYPGTDVTEADETLRSSGDSYSSNIIFAINPNISLKSLVKTNQPYGYDAAALFTNHPDSETTARINAVAYGSEDSNDPDYGAKGIVGRGLGWTRGVFVSGQAGADLQDTAFKTLTDKMSDDGAEIVGHTITPTVDNRSVVDAGMETLSQYGTINWIDHSADYNPEDIRGRGTIIADPYYTLDLFTKWEYKYIWSYNDFPPNNSALNILYTGGSGDPRPFFYYNNQVDDNLSDSEKLHLWSTINTTKTPDTAYADANIDSLISERGIHIGHEYMGYSTCNNHSFYTNPGTGKIEIYPTFDAELAYMASKKEEGLLWSPTVATMGDYLVPLKDILVTNNTDGTYTVTNNSSSTVTGVTLLAENAIESVTIDGKQLVSYGGSFGSKELVLPTLTSGQSTTLSISYGAKPSSTPTITSNDTGKNKVNEITGYYNTSTKHLTMTAEGRSGNYSFTTKIPTLAHKVIVVKDTTTGATIGEYTANSSGNITFSAALGSLHTFDIYEKDVISPNISDISATYNDNSAIISWTTDEAASSKVEYGTGTSYGSSSGESDVSPRVTSHSISISELASCTEYHYRVYSRDATGNSSYSGDNTFTTTGCPSPTPTPSDDGGESLPGDDDTSSWWRHYGSAYSRLLSEIISGLPTEGTMNSEIRFDATNLFPGKNIIKYLWDFGDGKTDEGRIVTHKYEAPGRYTIIIKGYDDKGNEYIVERTIDITPETPTILNIKAVNDTDLIIEGTGYQGDTIYLSIHSTPMELESNVDESGYWSYTIAQASETLGEGTHTVSAIDSYKLADNTELKSSSSPDTKFKVYVDNGKLKVEMEKTSRWRTIAYILGGIIVLGLVVYAVRRKGRR